MQPNTLPSCYRQTQNIKIVKELLPYRKNKTDRQYAIYYIYILPQAQYKNYVVYRQLLYSMPNLM